MNDGRKSFAHLSSKEDLHKYSSLVMVTNIADETHCSSSIFAFVHAGFEQLSPYLLHNRTTIVLVRGQ